MAAVIARAAHTASERPAVTRRAGKFPPRSEYVAERRATLRELDAAVRAFATWPPSRTATPLSRQLARMTHRGSLDASRAADAQQDTARLALAVLRCQLATCILCLLMTGESS